MTYLEIINDVLARLRENSVATPTTSAYSSLIGKFVNDAKRQVEDSWNWDALSVTTPITTVAGTSTYTLTGSGNRFKVDSVNDSTNQTRISNVPINWITNIQQTSTVQNAAPSHYAFNGTSGGDARVELYPTPNGIFTLQFNMYVPQATLSAGADVLLVPSEPVILGAYARALVERGEDGGLSSSEAYQLFKSSLSDHISIESTRFIENDEWVAC